MESQGTNKNDEAFSSSKLVNVLSLSFVRSSYIDPISQVGNNIISGTNNLLFFIEIGSSFKKEFPTALNLGMSKC